MTAVLVLVLLLMTSSARTARWTALVLWPVIAALVWQGAPYTGTSLNPARSLGPALLAPLLGPYWVYVAGPLLGGPWPSRGSRCCATGRCLPPSSSTTPATAAR